MAIEILTVPSDRTPLDLLLWRRFAREVPGLVEQTLALPQNGGLAELGVFLPAGTKVAVLPPVPQPRANRPVISLFD